MSEGEGTATEPGRGKTIGVSGVEWGYVLER